MTAAPPTNPPCIPAQRALSRARKSDRPSPNVRLFLTIISTTICSTTTLSRTYQPFVLLGYKLPHCCYQVVLHVRRVPDRLAARVTRPQILPHVYPRFLRISTLPPCISYPTKAEIRRKHRYTTARIYHYLFLTALFDPRFRRNSKSALRFILKFTFVTSSLQK